MRVQDGWMTWNSFKALCLIVLFVTLMGALSSCTTDEPIYYLYVTDYEEESYSVEIREYIGDKERIVCVLDRYMDSHSEPEKIIEALDTQIGFHTSLSASLAYWDLIADKY